MLYREAGQFKTSYQADAAIFPIRQDLVVVALIIIVAFVVVPLVASPYVFTGILIPFLILSLAALGLNILTGYAGQLSLGTAAFMAVGAFASYNFMLRVPGMPILLAFVGGGAVAALVGMLFGLPSLRIRGFYLAVATLAAQFFILWFLTKVGWVTNYSSSGVITAQQIVILGYPFTTPTAKYLLVLSIVAVLALAAKNMARGNAGRSWMAVRDMDVAAEVIGIRLMRAKLSAFAVSSFYCGVAGALFAYAYLGTVEPEAFNLDLSFRILFMVIIGGAGTVLGSFLGSAFVTLMPVLLSVTVRFLDRNFNLGIAESTISNLELMVFGALIIFFLIVEPHGLARLWADRQGKAAALAVPPLSLRLSRRRQSAAKGR
jgi:branched-chain amino acid transport system permease protein